MAGSTGRARLGMIRVAEPRVDVVVPLYLPGAWLDGCLGSLRAQRGVQARALFVDDDPKHPVALHAARRVPGARSLPTDRNRGFAAAANAGIMAGEADLVCVLNQDARLAPDYLARLATRFAADARLGSAAGKLLHLSRDGAPDGLLDSAGIFFRRGRRAGDIGQLEPDDGRYDGWREVFGVSGAAAVYRRDALGGVALENGPFDERYFMYKEDVDLAWRLRRAGWGSGVDGQAIGWHGRGVARGAAVGDGPVAAMFSLWRQELAKPTRARRLAWRNGLRTLIRNESAATLAPALPWIAAGQAVSAAFDLALDPIGGLRNRVSLALELPDLLRSRDGRREGDVARWLA